MKKAKRARRAKTKAVLINFDLPLHRRLEALRRGTTLTALVRDLVMQAVQAEERGRAARRLEWAMGRRSVV